MADKRISELTAATSLADADLIPIVQGGETKRLSGSAVKEYVASTDQPSVISVSSASDALRITQTGAGNALVVEDSANPDSTPTVIDQRGYVAVGDNVIRTGVYSNVASFNVSGLTQGTSGVSLFDWANNAYTGPAFFTQKSKSGIIGSQGIVASGDRLFISTFSGSDGAAFIPAASIEAFVDGTPGTNDMPGRLVFSTTADGASSPTERMRIDSAGNVGIGGTAFAGAKTRIAGSTSAVPVSYSLYLDQAIQNSVTSAFSGIATSMSVADAVFTLPLLRHFYADQGTKGANATVTNQFGFSVAASLTGATNNYGFYSNIASGTGRYNFYAAGSASNVFNGSIGIGGEATTGYVFEITKPLSGASTGISASIRINPDATVTSGAFGVSTYAINAVGASTPNIWHFNANQGTFSGTAPTNQFGFQASSALTGATNNYGFYSAIASGTGRYNFYAAGTASNYFGGDTVINVNSSSDALRITQTGAGNALVVEDSANPDSTPFVVDNAGKVIVGTNTSVSGTFSSAAYIQQMDNSGSINYSAGRFTNDSGSAVLDLLKSRSTTIGGQTVVQSGDALGNIYFSGSDGSSFIRGALIRAEVDGTPGTNDMPGRLVFSTTADGASSPTERMRIDNQGRVGIGSAATLSNVNLRVQKAITGSTFAYNGIFDGVSQSDVTSTGVQVLAQTGTASASFTTNQTGFFAKQGTFGAGSTVTNQYGFSAESSLTGATNNYGFYSNIASGTGRYNFYAAGTADNYFAGSVGINGIAQQGYFEVFGDGETAGIRASTASGNATFGVRANDFSSGPSYRAVLISQYCASATGTTMGMPNANLSRILFQNCSNAAIFTNGQSKLSFGTYSTEALYIDGGQSVWSIAPGSGTNGYGFGVSSAKTGATNNYGFYSNIASGTGRWNFYAAGTADNYFAGKVGIGTTSLTNKLEIGGSGDSVMRLLAAGQTNGLEIGQLTADGSSKIYAVNNNYLAFGTNNTERARLDSSGNLLITSTGGLGYGTGSGGAVTQATSRTTGVTLNKTNGAITLVSAAGSAAYQTFTVTNSTVAATDVIHVSQKSGTDKYIILVTAVAAGSFAITFATTGGTTTEQPVFNFAVLKAVAA